MANIESLMSEYDNDPSDVFIDPAQPRPIPLAPVSRPTIPEAASLHDIAFGGSESPFALTAQVLFENQGVIPPEEVSQLDSIPVSTPPLLEVRPDGGIVSEPIMLYFAEER